MSLAMTSAVWGLDPPLNPKILLLKLADCANDQGCIPYRPPGELALMCGISLTLAEKILGDFVETGVLVVEVSDTTNGRPLAYRLDVTKAAAFLPRKRRA